MNSKINVGWIFPIVVVSLLIGYLSTQFKYFDFDYTINLIDFLSLLATIYVAIYIAKKIQNSIESSRVEKDLIMDVIKSLIQKAKIILDKIEANDFDFNGIIADCKEFSMLLHDLEEYQQICKGQNTSSVLKPIFFNLKRLVTINSPVNGIITLPSGTQLTAKSTAKNLISSLITILVETNRK